MQNQTAVLMRREDKEGKTVTIWVATAKVKAFERRGFVRVRGGAQEKKGEGKKQEG